MKKKEPINAKKLVHGNYPDKQIIAKAVNKVVKAKKKKKR